MTIHRYAVMAGVTLFMLAHPAQAQDVESLPSENDYFAELPVVLSATRLPQRLDASPVAVSVIDRQMIKASGARDIEELLRLAPGMIVGHHDSHLGFATYHAFADRYARRMQILIDGRSVFLPHFGGVDWSGLPLAIEDIERIEVIRGPNAAAYGANAFLGTISIITRRPEGDNQAHGKLEAGMDGVFKALAGYDDTVGRLDYRLTASRWGDDGFDQPAGFEDDRTISLFNSRFLFHATPETRWEFQFGAGREDAITSQPADFIVEPPHDETTERIYQQVRWEHESADAQQFTVQFFHSEEKVQEQFESLPIPSLGGITADYNRDIQSERYDLEFQHILRMNTTTRFVWGAGTRLDRVQSPTYFSGTDWIDNDLHRLFAHAEWRITPQLLSNVGVMLEHSEFSGGDISPNLSLNYTPEPGHTLRLSAAKAVRTPVTIEHMAEQRFIIGPLFNQEFSTSGTLDSEKIASFDLGYIGRFLDNSVTLDARLFHDEITDIITYYLRDYPDTINQLAFDFRNLDSLTIKGAEMQLNYQPGKDARLVANYAYAYLNSTDIDEGYSRSGPRHNASLLGIARLFGSVTGSFGFYYMSDYDGLDTGGHIPVTRRLDLRMAFPITLGNNPAEVAFVAQSALGEYQDLRSINNFDTRVFASLSFKL